MKNRIEIDKNLIKTNSLILVESNFYLASAEENFYLALPSKKETIKIKNFSTTVVALAEGNFYLALPSKKETIK